MSRKAVLKIAAVAAVAASLSGCALLSTPKPVQLYRFGGGVAAASVPSGACTPVTVSLRRVDFPTASAGDRLLAVTGSEAAYIKDARWVVGAETLFTDSLRNAFAAQAPCVTLSNGPSGDGVVLNVDIRQFETAYAQAGDVPEVRVAAVVRLLRPVDRSVVAQETFIVNQQVDSNRVASIVSAYDLASRDLNQRIVGWTDGHARQAAVAAKTTR